MPVTLRVLVNEDDALLYWRIPAPIPGCRGFAIERRIVAQGVAQAQDFLLNRMGFENQPLPPDPKGFGFSKPSTEWPFQRFSWTDHDAGTGDTVSYRVIPMIRAGNGHSSTRGRGQSVQRTAQAWADQGRDVSAVLQPRIRHLTVHGALPQSQQHYCEAIQAKAERRLRKENSDLSLW